MSHERQEKLHFRCACGARISAPAGALGRHARCPKCAATVALTSPEEPIAKADPASAPRATVLGADQQREKIRVRCGCGATVSAPADAAGRRARCPKCGSALRLGGAPESGGLLRELARGASLARPARDAAPGGPAGGINDDEVFRIAAPVDVLRERPAAPVGPEIACPSCGRTWPARSVLCTACGVNLKTGRSLLTTQDEQLDEAYMRAEAVVRWASWLIWAGILPIASEAFGTRRPWVVRGIAAVTIVVSVWFMLAYLWDPTVRPDLKNWMLWGGDTAALRDEFAQALASDGASAEQIAADLAALDSQVGRYSDSQLFTHMLLHADPLHLLGNLLFLMVLGLRVNTLIGNVLTLLLYPLLGLFAAWATLADAAGGPPFPMLGASGAIMGLAGMYIVLFPAHKVHVAMWLRWGLLAGFHLSAAIKAIPGFWVVLFYIAFDVVYTVRGVDDGVAHWAHLGGFLAGVFFAALLLVGRLVNGRGGDLFSIVLGRYAWALIGKPNDRRLSLW